MNLHKWSVPTTHGDIIVSTWPSATCRTQSAESENAVFIKCPHFWYQKNCGHFYLSTSVIIFYSFYIPPLHICPAQFLSLKNPVYAAIGGLFQPCLWFHSLYKVCEARTPCIQGCPSASLPGGGFSHTSCMKDSTYSCWIILWIFLFCYCCFVFLPKKRKP